MGPFDLYEQIWYIGGGKEICLVIPPWYGLGTRRMLIIQFLVTPQRGERD